MEGFIAKPLAFHRINQAYPVVRAVRPGLGPDEWRRVAGRYATENVVNSPSGRGAVAVENPNGYIVGLFCYAACDHLRHKKSLSIEWFISLDLFNSSEIIEIMLQKISDLAHQMGCDEVLAVDPALGGGDSESWRILRRRFGAFVPGAA